MNNLFFSFSSSNRKFADLIANNHLQNYDIWSMSNINPGDNYDKEIVNQLAESSGSILLLSKSYFDSEPCMNELKYIMEKKDKDPTYKVYPLLLSRVGISDRDLNLFKDIQLFPTSSRTLEEMDNTEFNAQMSKLKKIINDDFSINILNNPMWVNIESFLDDGLPNIWPLRGQRETKIKTNDGKISLLIPINGDDTNFNLKIKVLETRIEEDHYVLESSKKSLFRSIYSLFEIIDDKFTQTSAPLKEVVQESIKEWREVGKLSRAYGELERGLLGELWFLNFLIDVNNEEVVHNWRGPDNDRHDFRINQKEFEIKTTKNSRREHIISNIEQLEPSKDCDLFMISIQISPDKNSSSSISVLKKIKEIESKLTAKDIIDTFKIKIEAYINEDFEEVYKMDQEYIFSTEKDPLVFVVDENFPKFKKDEYEALSYSDNISDISYRLDLHSINSGKSCESKIFKKMLKLN